MGLFDDSEKFAAIDIGSNGFHLAIAERQGDKLKKLASMSEKVQLASGLNPHGELSKDVQIRGLDCLSRFVGRISDIRSDRLRVVATNALRQAVNGDEFIRHANAILPVPIEVISGREEARLVYLGVAHTNPSKAQRLVIDIGGGSSELIIGKGLTPFLKESAQMGSVSFSQRFFASGQITHDAFERAIYASQKEIIKHAKRYTKTGFDEVIGSSGTIKAVAKALPDLGYSEITPDAVEALKAKLIATGTVDAIEMTGVKAHRKAIFPAGVAILLAIMKVFAISRLSYSDGALKEGVMYDMLARLDANDVRNDSVRELMSRFDVDKKQAKRVAKTAVMFFDDVCHHLGLVANGRELLYRAGLLHEIGLAIGHTRYHQHSAYMLHHADMAGFSRNDQALLSHLVQYHRRSISEQDAQTIQAAGGTNLMYLALLLRLAVATHHDRCDISKQQITLHIKTPTHWQLTLTADSPEQQTRLIDLGDEVAWFEKWGVILTVEKAQNPKT